LFGATLTRNEPPCRVHPISTLHVTLLYDKRVVDEQPITVREFVLVRSLHGQTRHTDVARWQLRG
jgi:hypothetical protein